LSIAFRVLFSDNLMYFEGHYVLLQYLFSTGYARLVDFHTVKLHVQTNNRNFFYLFFEKYITRKSHKFSNSKNTYIIVDVVDVRQIIYIVNNLSNLYTNVAGDTI
jgi:hypothetical protein